MTPLDARATLAPEAGTRRRVLRGAWLSLGAVVLGVLAHGLVPQAFCTGDQGVKLVATRHVLADPWHALELPLPRIGERLFPELAGTFYVPHDGHAHALTSELFPMLSALPFAVFGWRGLYLLPAIAWLVTLWLGASLSRTLEPEANPAWSVAVLCAGTPLLFYSLEFWEHMPAVALTTAATLVAFRAGGPTPRSATLVGLLMGTAFLLRPEALGYGVALALFARRPAYLARHAAGFALSQIPFVAYHLAHFGNLFGQHLGANAAAALHTWASTRTLIAHAWFLDGIEWLPFAVAWGIMLAIAASGGRSGFAGFLWGPGVLLMLAASLWLVTAAALGRLPSHGFWGTFPLATLGFWPSPSPAERRHPQEATALRRVALAFIALTWLTAPNDGGAQWGPRYLLPACVPLALVAAQSLRRWYRVAPRRWVGLTVVAALALGSVWLQRASYRDLRIAKRIHARIAKAVGQEAGGARVVLSDLPWLDQLAASQERLTFLYAGSAAEARAAIEALQAARASPVLIVRSRSEAPAEPTEDWLARTCYEHQTSGTLDDRQLSFARVACPGADAAETSAHAR